MCHSPLELVFTEMLHPTPPASPPGRGLYPSHPTHFPKIGLEGGQASCPRTSMPVPLASLEGQRFGKMSPSLCPQHPNVTPGMSGAAALRLPHPTSKLSLYFRDRDQHASTHPSGICTIPPGLPAAPLPLNMVASPWPSFCFSRKSL